MSFSPCKNITIQLKFPFPAQEFKNHWICWTISDFYIFCRMSNWLNFLLCFVCLFFPSFLSLPRSQESRSRGHAPRQSNHMVPMRNSNSPKSSMKTKQAFLLQATRLTKLARHMCRDIIRLRRAARRPFVPINCGAIKAECKSSFNSS